MKKNTRLGCLCALGCETLFGFSYVFTKSSASHASALALLGWRFLVAAISISLCAAIGLVKLNLKGKSAKPLLRIALLCPVIYFSAETFGIQWTTASESGAFLACIPVISLAASSLLLHERPSRLQILGILITLAGVLITVFAVGASSSLSVPGYLLLCIAVVSYALYSVYVEKASDFSSAELTFVMQLSGAMIFVLLAFIEALHTGTVRELVSLPLHDRRFILSILFQSTGCSVLAFFLANVAIANIGVNRTSSFIGVSTVVSIIAGIFLLKEPFSAFQVLGAVVIIAGVYTANAKASGSSI